MNDDLKAKLAETDGHTDGPWYTFQRIPNRFLVGTKPWIDPSNGEDICEFNLDLSKGTAFGNTQLVALAPELKAEVLRQDALIGELVVALERSIALGGWTLSFMLENEFEPLLKRAKEQS